MSDKTANQIIANGELTHWLNEDLPIQQFNVIAINLLQKKLDAIEWDDRFSKWRDATDGNKLFWFFIKGGTALRILFQHKKQTDIMPAPSDWDSQIVINPELPFDLWYRAYQKIEVAVNEALYLANMCFTLLPSAKTSLDKHPDKGEKEKYFNMGVFVKEELKARYDKASSNPIAALNSEWGGELNYRPAGDRKTAYLCNMFHPLQSGDLSRQRFANVNSRDWQASDYQLILEDHAKNNNAMATLANATKDKYLAQSKKSLIVVGRAARETASAVFYVVIFDDKGHWVVKNEIQLIDRRHESPRQMNKLINFEKLEPMLEGDKLDKINIELTKTEDKRDKEIVKTINTIKQYAFRAADFDQDMIFDSMYPQETIDVNQREYKTIENWRKAKEILLEALTDQEIVAQINKHYEYIEKSLQTVATDKKSLISWLNSKRMELGVASEIAATADAPEVEALLQKHLPLNANAPLASGQKTLIIDEFYLHRLEVRYKYKKPTVLVGEKSQPQYIDAWTASGNLRGELIDVTVPRRDTFECQHHYKLLKDLTEHGWQVITPSCGVTGLDKITLSILNEGYHIEEQILITREILAGKSSAPKKLHKRIQRGYSLGITDSKEEERKQARFKVIAISHQQFIDTYGNMPIITDVKRDLDLWAAGTLSPPVALKNYFDRQTKENAHLFKCDLDENNNRSNDKVTLLRNFMDDVSKDDDYPDVWRTEFKTKMEDTVASKLNAGMLDFFYITAIFAEVAKEINAAVNKIDLKRGATGQPNMREMLKYLINLTADNNHVFIQLTGSAANYHHLKEQDESFGKAADDELIVGNIAIRCLYDDSTDDTAVKLIHSHSIATLPKEFTATGIDKTAYEKLIKECIRYEEINADKKEEQRTEYAYGMPVINLNTHIKALENNIRAAEFSKGEQLKDELDLLNRALTTREYGNRYQGMPKLKRALSCAQIPGLKVGSVNK